MSLDLDPWTGQRARSPLMTVRKGVGTYFYWSAPPYQHYQTVTGGPARSLRTTPHSTADAHRGRRGAVREGRLGPKLAGPPQVRSDCV